MIDFELTEEQQMIRDTVGAFAREEIRPAARRADEDGKVPPELVEKIWQMGVVQSAIPEKFGGAGDARTALTGAIVTEELGYGDLAIAAHALAPRLLAHPVIDLGTEGQRERYLRPLAGGRFASATAALVEPRFDFDTTSLSTTARSAGGQWVLNGRKCLVPLAPESESILVYASSDSSPGTGVKALIVPRTASGVTVLEREKNMGLKALATYGVEFRDCKAAPDAVLGDDGAIDFQRLMSQSRIGISALAIGMSRAAFEYARDYAKERRAFGSAIAQKQAIAFILADMAIEVDAMRLLVWQAAWELDQGKDALKASYLAKNYVAASSLKITDNAVQCLGGHGYIREHPVEMWLRNARGIASIEGIATV